MSASLRLAVVACLAAVAQPASAAGGTISDQDVSFNLPATHWSPTALADLTGAGASPSTDVLAAWGWWYRVSGTDVFEHPMPAPSTETYSGWIGILGYPAIGPRGFTASETLLVTDNERPSGTLRNGLCIQNHDSSALVITLFHYLDADAGGTPASDTASLIQPGYLLQQDGAAEDVHYWAPNPVARAVRPAGGAGNLLGLLNDGTATVLDNVIAPGPADLAAAYQFDLSIAAGQTGCAQVSFSTRVQERVVKGDSSRDNLADILFQKPTTGEVRGWDMRRGSRLQHNIYSALPANFDIVGQDDFYGNYYNTWLTRDRTTGQVSVYLTPLQGAQTLPLNWRIGATGDFNADGRADILWRNTTSQKLVVWLMNGSQKIGNLVPQPDQAVDANWEVVAAVDFDQDGVRDLLWYNQTSGKLVVWQMDALVHRISGDFTNPSSVGSNAWKAVAAGDYGRGVGGPRSTKDILWRNDASGKLVIWYMDAFRNRTSGVFTSPDAPEPPLDPLEWKVVGPR